MLSAVWVWAGPPAPAAPRGAFGPLQAMGGSLRTRQGSKLAAARVTQ
jgi:hypothetical protein